MANRDEQIKTWIRENYPNEYRTRVRAGMTYPQLAAVVQDLSGGLPSVLGQVPDDVKDTRIFGSIDTTQATTVQTTTSTTASSGAITVGNTITGVAGSQATVVANGNQLTFTIPRGSTGATGAAGSDGNDGAQGTQGIQGIQGIQGDTGSTGATGATGPQGIQGIQGPAGLVWRGAWSSATAYVLGDVVSRDGHSYVNILASTNNQPPNATYWELLADAGAQGPQGSQGIQGNTGSTGATGPQGAQGIQGIQGPAGSQGATGAQGATGSAGATGAAGANGVGVPAGGAAGTALTKIDATDYNTEWGGQMHFPTTATATTPTSGFTIGAGTAYSNIMKIQTPAGYLDIGMGSATWAHFATSASYFYFQKPLQINGGDGVYAYDGDFWVRTDNLDNTITERITVLGGDSLTAGETRVGIANTTPATELDVSGTIRQSATTDGIVYADANGDLNKLTIGANLTLTGNSLAAAGGGGSAGVDIYHNGGQVGSGAKTKLDFVGAGVAVADTSSSTATITIAGGGGGGGGIAPPVGGPIVPPSAIPPSWNKVIMTGMGDGTGLTITTLPSTNWMLSTMNQADGMMVIDASGTPVLFTFRDADTGQLVSGPTIGIQPFAGVDWFFIPDDGTGQPRYYLSGYSGGDGRRNPFGLL